MYRADKIEHKYGWGNIITDCRQKYAAWDPSQVTVSYELLRLWMKSFGDLHGGRYISPIMIFWPLALVLILTKTNLDDVSNGSARSSCGLLMMPCFTHIATTFSRMRYTRLSIQQVTRKHIEYLITRFEQCLREANNHRVKKVCSSQLHVPHSKQWVIWDWGG